MTTHNNTTHLILKRNIQNGISNLFFFIILSAINMVLIFVGSDVTFTFSAYLPEFLISLGQVVKAETGNISPLIIFTILAILFLIGCLISALLAKKRPGWLMLATALVGIDTLIMLAIMLPQIGNLMATSPISIIIYIVFHIWILFYLINALIANDKLKKLPAEPQTYEVPYTVALQDGNVTPVDKSNEQE